MSCHNEKIYSECICKTSCPHHDFTFSVSLPSSLKFLSTSFLVCFDDFFWVRISCIPGLILNFSSFCLHPSWVLGLYAYTTTPNHVIKPRSSYIADNLPNKMKLQFHASAFYVCYWECSQFLVSWTPQRNSQCITWTSGSSVEESKRNQKDKIQ